MNVTLRQLRAFAEVARRRSFTSAARHLAAAMARFKADFGVGTFRTSEPEVQLDTLYAPLVMMSSASTFHYLVDRAASQAGHCAVPAYEVGYMGTAIALVEAGLGIDSPVTREIRS